MSNTSDTRHSLVARTVTTGLLAFVGLTAGCGASALGPTPSPSFAGLMVTSLSDSIGSTGGGAEVTIEGIGFLKNDGGPVVLFGGAHAWRVSLRGSTTIVAKVPPHPAGPVEVVVSNPDGQTARLAGAYTYVSPDSLDSNGEWEGRSLTDHLDFTFRFVIQNNRLTGVSCGTSGMVFVPAPSLSNGEFAFFQGDGVVIAGRLVSAREATGTINLAPCTKSDWVARKLASSH